MAMVKVDVTKRGRGYGRNPRPRGPFPPRCWSEVSVRRPTKFSQIILLIFIFPCETLYRHSGTCPQGLPFR